MDFCIKFIIVIIAILNTVTARSYHNNRIKRHYEEYEHGQSQWPSYKSYEPSKHGPRDVGHSPEEDYYGHPSTEYENMSQDSGDCDNSKKDFEGHGAFWDDNSRGSNEDRQGWEGSRMFNEPNKNNRFNMPWSLSNMRPSAPTATVLSSTTTSPLTIVVCIRSCQVTSEYNPVCGSNNVTYSNPGRLECAQNCGVDVQLQRSSPCPRPTPADTNAGLNPTSPTPVNTNTPRQPVNDVKPTRFTTVDVSQLSTASPVTNNNNGITISQDLLSSIFTNPSSTEEGEDIDIRQDERNAN